MSEVIETQIESIPIDKIHILNPRVRSARAFREVIDSIAALGLKRPITVTRRIRPEGTEYDLVCGQGRLEAYQSLGQSHIAALIIEATSEDCMVMSLVENVARRKHRTVDLLHDVHGMRLRGYSDQEVADKTGLKLDYTRGVINLLERREHRLLMAVESGQMPLSVAVEIASAKDKSVQEILQQAYEKNLLRGRRLIEAKRLIERRDRRARGERPVSPALAQKCVSVDGLLRTYRESADKKRLLVKKANLTKGRLVFVTEALSKLISDEAFRQILASEQLSTLPHPLAERIEGKVGSA